MNEVFIDIRKEDEDIKKYFINADFVNIERLINCIEDLDSEVKKLKEEQEDIEKVREFYEKREKELLSRVKEWY